ncbi:hypothetical protein OEZ86_007015 [Tetradesmus obliquus]|nr:hypothetical protein OEZ86_007015 [Tetradesmus obliquus]
MNARGKLAVDIVSYLFSVISPHTKDRGPFLVQQEVDGSKTVCLTIRPLHANAAIGTPHHTVSGNSRDEAHARQLTSLQMLQHLEVQGILPDDWWRWQPGWLNSAEPSVLRFLMLAYLLILKEACWVARKSVIRFRISAEARHVAAQVLDTLLQEGSVVENSQQQVRLATAQEFSRHQQAPRRHQQQQRAELPPRRISEPAGTYQQPYAAAAAAPAAEVYVAPFQQARHVSPDAQRYGRSSSRDEPYMRHRDDPVHEPVAAGSYDRPQADPYYAGYPGKQERLPQQVPHRRDAPAPVGVYAASRGSHSSSQGVHGRGGSVGAAGWPNERPVQQQQWHGREREWSGVSDRGHRERSWDRERPQDRDRPDHRGDRDGRGRGRDNSSSRGGRVQQRERPASERDSVRDRGHRDSSLPLRDRDGRNRDGSSSSKNKRQRQDEPTYQPGTAARSGTRLTVLWNVAGPSAAGSFEMKLS